MEAAFFDLDKTIISRSSSLALSRPLYRAGMVSRSQLLRGAYAQLVYLLVGADEDKMERLKEGMLALTKGWNQEQVETLVREVIFDVIDPYVYQEALDLMALHRSEGRRIYIVSSSPEEVVRPLSRHFGASGVIATRAEIDDEGRYTGELAFYAYGDQKAEAIEALAERLGIDLDASYAYSDSVTDLPMLSVVGHPVAVNPDRDLRREAEERGWQVRDFRRPVRLRTRIAQAVPPPKPSIAAAAGAAAVAAVLVWVVLRSRSASSGRLSPLRLRPSRAGCTFGCGCREVPARGAEPTRESCRGRHAQAPGATPPAPEHVQTRRLIPAPLALRLGPGAPRGIRSARRGGVLQQIGEPFGPDRGLERASCADVARDQRELTLDRRRERAPSVVHQWIESSHSPVEAFDRDRERTLATGSVVVERDDLCHDAER